MADGMDTGRTDAQLPYLADQLAQKTNIVNVLQVGAIAGTRAAVVPVILKTSGVGNEKPKLIGILIELINDAAANPVTRTLRAMQYQQQRSAGLQRTWLIKQKDLIRPEDLISCVV